MALTPEEITAKNFKTFYEGIKPYLNGRMPNHGFTPIGTVILVMGADVPNNYLKCDGSLYSIESFSELANYFEDQYGTKNYFGGDGTTTFAVPNVQGTPDEAVSCIAYRNIFLAKEDEERKIDFTNPRWLTFDPLNRKGLLIKSGTKILLNSGMVLDFKKNFAIDLSTFLTEAGKDYFLFVSDTGVFSAYSNKSSGTGLYVGRFHTLCVDAGAALTMIVPDSPSSGTEIGSKYLVKPYSKDMEPEFYEFYNKTVTAVSVGTPYDVITCEHPLRGFEAGDILPESVFTDSFGPHTLHEDAMVYDKTTNIFVDVYLQSGTGRNTKSEYNATHTVSRQAYNHLGDMLTVGKQLLSDGEFTSIALGSNECTAIQGASDKTTVGGHVDTAGRRMISAIGCEECCGYLWTWMREVGFNGQGTYKATDGKGTFGQENGEPYILTAGGAYGNSSNCGSRSRDCGVGCSSIAVHFGARGCVSLNGNTAANGIMNQGENGYIFAYVVGSTPYAADWLSRYSGGTAFTPVSDRLYYVVSEGNYKEKLFRWDGTRYVTPEGGGSDNYSTDETVIGTWIDGKPIYRKVYDYSSSPLGDTTINVSSLNIDRLIYSDALGCDSSSGYKTAPVWIVNSVSDSASRQLYLGTDKKIYIKGSMSTYYVILEYTKTTD